MASPVIQRGMDLCQPACGSSCFDCKEIEAMYLTQPRVRANTWWNLVRVRYLSNQEFVFDSFKLTT